MIFEYPPEFKGIGYYQGFSLILWIVGIALLFILGATFFFKIFKLDTKAPKLGFLSYSLFCVFFGLTRLVYILAVYSTNSYDYFVLWGYIFSILSVILYLYVLETQAVTFTHKVFTIIMIVCFSITLIALFGYLTRDLAVIFMWALAPFGVAVIMVLYIYIAVKTTSKVRTKAILILIGISLIFSSHLMDSELFITSFPFVPLYIPPIFLIVGLLIFTYAQLFIKTESR